MVESDFAEVLLVVRDSENVTTEDSTINRSLVATLCGRLDRYINARGGDSLSPAELTPLMEHIRTVHLGNGISSLPDLDVLLALDRHVSLSELSILAKHGIWYVHEDSEENSEAVAMAELRIAGTDRTRTLYRSHSAINSISPYLGQAANVAKFGDIILHKLSDLSRHGDTHVCAGSTHSHFESSREQSSTGNLGAIRTAARWFPNILHYKLNQKLRKEQWFIAYRENSGIIPTSPKDMAGFQPIYPPRDRFYADPFIVERNGKHHIFFEDYRYKQRKGLISVIEIDQHGYSTHPEVVLERPYHLSYPNVFEREGEWFMLPETRDNKTVELYRAVDFPRRWVLEKVLLKNAPAVDPTLFEHDGKQWLFVGGMLENSSPNEDLFLYSADSLFSDWLPHRRNPVISDVRSARPAGQIFIHNGRMIRPSQDCAVRYGYALRFNRVETLTETEYVETPVGHISAEWHPRNLGTHTFNQNSRFQVVDGRALVFK